MRRSLPFLLFALATATALWLSAQRDQGRPAARHENAVGAASGAAAADVASPPPAATPQRGSSVWPPPSQVVLPRREIEERSVTAPPQAPQGTPDDATLGRRIAARSEAQIPPMPIAARMPEPVSATPQGDGGMPPLHPVSSRPPPTPPPVIAFGAPVSPTADPTLPPPVQEHPIETNTDMSQSGVDGGSLLTMEPILAKILRNGDAPMLQEPQGSESSGTGGSSSSSSDGR